jgi:thiol:disulfide interchange protein
MKTIALGAAMLGLLAALLAPGLTSAQDTADHKVKWFSYEEGLALAESQHKPVVIYFYAEWCAYCVRMEKETYADPKVIEFLNNRAVAVKVDVDREREVARRYAVRGLPATYLLLPGGDQIGPLPGFIPPRSYLAMLTKILAQS